jgi:TfoX/Sxy family transcriptional regulator of competence genes
MSEPYLADLTKMATGWMEADDRVGVLECRHFFSGAAVYRDGSIVVSLTPVGLAFKVKAEVREYLLDSGRASPLRYFPKSPIKRDYVLFRNPILGAREATQLIVGDDMQG